MSRFNDATIPALDSNGNPISGATWNFYLTGTLTPQAVYSNNSLSVSLGASVTANSAGRFVPIFLDDDYTYRAILKDGAGVTISPFDIDPANPSVQAEDIEGTFRSGVNISGKIGTGIRPEGQLVLTNDPADPGHTIISLAQYIADEESAIESVGKLSTGAVQQQGAWFWRWVDDDNTPGAYEVVTAFHMVKTGQDNTPLELWGRNAVRVCRGDTSNESWHDPPAANIFEVWTSARVGTSVAIGPSVLSNAAAYTVNTVGGFRFECEGYGQFGTVVGGSMDESVQVGHNGTTGFIQSFNRVGAIFSPLSIAGLTISIGNTGQSVGFMGATPVTRPALPAAATDLATVITLANAIRTALINNGLASA
jgi:hypothetical protein